MSEVMTSEKNKSISAIAMRWELSGLALFAVFWLWATLPGLQEIFLEATSNEESSHILLVPLIAGYIVWLRRQSLVWGEAFWERALGPVIMIAGWTISHWGHEQYLKSVEQFGWLVLGLGGVVACCGLRLLIPIWPALIVMLFLIPVPGRLRAEIAIPLQAWTAEVTEMILVAVGVPVSRMGSVLEVNGEPVGIAEACNGARMVYAVFLICYAYAFTSKLRPWAMATFLVLSPLVAMACNIVRVIPTVLMYGYSSKELAGLFHDLAGWGVVLLAFFGIHLLAKIAGWLGLPVEK